MANHKNTIIERDPAIPAGLSAEELSKTRQYAEIVRKAALRAHGEDGTRHSTERPRHVPFEDTRELDRFVASFTWTDDDLRPGSDKRKLVAGLLDSFGLIEETVASRVPNGWHTVVPAVKGRVIEKVLCISTGDSKVSQWKGNSFWKPLNGTSVSAWCRGISKAITRSVASRTLRSLDEPISKYDTEDGGNLLDETKESKESPRSLLDGYSNIVVPRPMGRERRRLLSLGHVTADDLREAGYWDRSLDRFVDSNDYEAGLDTTMGEERATALMLAKLTDTIDGGTLRYLMAALPEDDDRETVAKMYLADQSTKSGVKDDAELEWRMENLAARHGMTLWGLVCRLGTQAARTL